jgi:hypothetical protein
LWHPSAAAQAPRPRLPDVNGTSHVSALGTWMEPLRAASYAARRERKNNMLTNRRRS